METNQQLQAEILARYQVARMSPRDWPSVTKQLVAACQNPDFARMAYCVLPLALGHGEALSIRYAELAQQLMRNVASDSVPIGEDSEAVHYRVTVTDLESNTPLSEMLRAPKKAGDPRLQVGSAKRALLLALVPAEVRARCVAECRSVVRREDGKVLGAVSKDVLADLKALGVEPAEIKEYLGHAPATLEIYEVERLRSIAMLIRDGELTWAAVMLAERAAAPAPRKEAPEPSKKPKAPKAARETRGATTHGPPPPEPPKPPPVSRRDSSDPESAADAVAAQP